MTGLDDTGGMRRDNHLRFDLDAVVTPARLDGFDVLDTLEYVPPRERSSDEEGAVKVALMP